MPILSGLKHSSSNNPCLPKRGGLTTHSVLKSQIAFNVRFSIAFVVMHRSADQDNDKEEEEEEEEEDIMKSHHH
jgi:hypothetical protein